ncbi:hypothetical protein GUJ93_ZPchr0007g5685 [Zizania palustris]|uniref:DUF632 domain-containing protein n=1 Tax=Zizania palustris TaxID=103762 RepID=A0A8J5TJ51_ZIZPA|nr:hypothetical protein GUJ93_ZPchr0007g5685 [Zizania palustris]
MGCTTSHDAFAAAAAASRARPSSSCSWRQRRRADPAALCGERAALIRAAADRRFALASAHAAYFRSLAAVGDALRRFAAAALVPGTPPSGSSPVLTLPPSPAKPVDAAARSSLPPSPSSSSTVSPLSHSLSDEHLKAHCDGKHAAATGTNAQSTQGETSYSYGYTYPYRPFGEVIAEERPESVPRPLGTPPTAETSMWGFFDPFTSYDQFLEEYSRYKGQVDGTLPSNSPNYAELKRMEGIPELEDEAVASKPSTPAPGVYDQSGKGKRPVLPNAGAKGEACDGKGSGGNNGKPEKPAGSTSNKGSSTTAKKKAVALVENGPIAAVVEGDGATGECRNSIVSSESFSPLHEGKRDVMEAMDEFMARLDEAMNFGSQVSRLLEVGKAPLPHRTSSTPRLVRHLCSKVMDPLALTVPASTCLPKPHKKSRTSSGKASTWSTSSVAGRRNGAGNLSSTLEKLCLWEKKLFKEIKDEERLRILYEKKYKRLKSMDERRSEPSTIESARFRRMWKGVLECHEKQLSVIQDSKTHLVKAVTISQSNAAAVATVELERELAKWYRCFNKWISSMRSYAEALNGWLRKWLPDTQEENTPDGAPPFSPGRLGAPPVFLVSNDWFQAIQKVPKNQVLKAIDQFSKLVHELKKSQQSEHRQKRKADHASRDYNKRCEVLQMELGLTTSLDTFSDTEDTRRSHDGRVIELDKMRKKKDDEKTKHEEIVKHANLAASATLPVGLVSVLQQTISFFQGNLHFYSAIRIEGA